jgi:4-amino-4-deoxy-L-arabinose transferase-like glycosyltransferase
MFAYSKLAEPEMTPTKTLFFALFCVVWVGTGLIGHDPWKPDEVYSFGLAFQMLQSGDWLVPALAGEPAMDKPPLFYITSAAFAQLFSPLLPLHDGARLASGFYNALTLMFIGFAGRELFGKGRGWIAAVILIGCLGMLVRTHFLVTDLALLSGSAMMIYGYALSLRRTILPGILIGTGVGIGFMSKGFIAPILFLSISSTLLLFPAWRNRSFLTTLAVALVSALPWLAIWPYLLYQRSPQLFMEWAWKLNIGRWLDFARHGKFDEVFYYVKILPWFAWPALPMGAWAVWHARKKVLQQPEFQLLLVTFLVMLVTLSIVPNIEEIFALPMLLPLALLATASLSSLRRGAANALDWFGIMTFGFIAILMWWGWFGLQLDNDARITHWLKNYQPEVEPTFQLLPFCLAVGASVLWVVLVWRVGRSIRRAAINWAAGVTLLWVLAMTLWLPWLDSSKSYRSMVASLAEAIPEKHECIASRYLGDGQKAMLHYFGNILTKEGKERSCDLLLTHGNLSRSDKEKGHWTIVWEGGRRGEKNERYYLYQRQS